jgi:hypothetical protein
MVTKTIEVTKQDIDQLEVELKDTNATKLNPLFFRFTSLDEMILIERKYAENLVQLFSLNHRKKIPTKLEVVTDERY